MLASGNGFLVFTTGESVRLAPSAQMPANLPLGASVRVTLDESLGLATALAASRAPAAGDLPVTRLPRRFLANASGSRRVEPPQGAAGGAIGAPVTLTIEVRVPDNTPQNDDVFLSTDRTNFGPAEVRMLRLDARTWSASLQIAANEVLRYEFTRGSFATIERDRLGGIVVPRSLTARANETRHDVVARWADL